MIEKILTISNGKEIIVRKDGKILNLEHCEYAIQTDKAGYCAICVSNKRFLVHRLVAEAFLPNYRNERTLQVHHKDFNKSNNAASNLVCMEMKDHQRLHKQKYSYIKKCAVCGKEFTPHPTKRERAKTCSPACAAIMVKQSAQKRCRQIKQYKLDGTFIKQWPSEIEIEKELKIYGSNVVKCCKNIIRSYKGYKWEYAS